ncbi:MAG: type II toxin-antitoxin system RelE/ParE family toxin [Bacteroidota bacterium]
MGKQLKENTKDYEVKLSTYALHNIDEITGYIAFIDHQPINAIKVGNAIFDTIERISLHPFAFRECEELATKVKKYRRAVCLTWLIIYKISGSTITILGIIHTSRRPHIIRTLKKNK